jgi:Fe2+ or Zn2+ uptake regulation protein
MPRKIDNKTSNHNNLEALHAYWDGIPKYLFVDIEKEVLETHPARSAILRILREGISDKIENQPVQRRILNAEEIRKLLKNERIELSKTGMYFHLNTLEEVGLIKVVARILQKRHKVAYYGRVAHHLFIRESETRSNRYAKLLSELRKLLLKKYPNEHLPTGRTLAKEYESQKRRREEILGKWLIDNEDTINELNLEFNVIFDALKLIDSCNPGYQDIFREILKLVKMDR